MSSKELPIYSYEDVQKHNKYDDCWIVLGTKVYDITTFLEDHPGGSKILLENGGKNATDAFIEVGHITNYSIISMIKDFLIGRVTEETNSKL